MSEKTFLFSVALTALSETVLLGPSSETPNSTPLRHDILEVNQYLMSGLEKSVIDQWFMGPVPTFVPQDLGIPGYNLTVRAALQKAREYLDHRDPSETPITVPPDVRYPSVSYNTRTRLLIIGTGI